MSLNLGFASLVGLRLWGVVEFELEASNYGPLKDDMLKLTLL